MKHAYGMQQLTCNAAPLAPTFFILWGNSAIHQIIEAQILRFTYRISKCKQPGGRLRTPDVLVLHWNFYRSLDENLKFSTVQYAQKTNILHMQKLT